MGYVLLTLASILVFLLGAFLIALILMQKGKGGGLAGAMGAPGGHSAFGAKSQDTLSRLTLGAAIVWIVLCSGTIVLMNNPGTPVSIGEGSRSSGSDSESGGSEPSGTAPSTESAPSGTPPESGTPAPSGNPG